ncbi:hypothetical protein IJJ05_02810 [Candidatus Saccharibacteria bacterium]|nr:hypothetical protein [Candidatus Saccharibacteria bacterium]
MMDIRISEVKMQRSDSNQTAQMAHRKVKSSTTLNRKYVKKPMKNTSEIIPIKRSSKLSHFNRQIIENKANLEQEKIAPAEKHPVQTIANNRMKERKMVAVQTQKQQLSAQELKEQAIRKALLAASKVETKAKTEPEDEPIAKKMHFGFGRVTLALSCAAVAVFAIAYFVNLNMPDISLRVAAMQSGLEASYPSYVPRDYSITSITSEDGKVVLNFKKHADGSEFTLTEEKSSWDSNALFSNYVKTTYDENYLVIREQGLTIYVSESNAAWVNGGVVYKLTAVPETLSKKQITSIAVSL